MNDRTQAASSGKGQSYHIDLDTVPKVIRENVSDHLGKDAVLHSSKTDGKYMGPVVHMDDQYLVQAIGKNRNSAIIHDVNSVEMKGAALKTRAANKDLEGRNLQIHYKGDKGRAYPWNVEKEQQEKKEVTPEQFMENAEEYVKSENMNKAQREVFIKGVEKVVESTFSANEHRQQEQQQHAKGKEVTKDVSKTKQAEASIER